MPTRIQWTDETWNVVTGCSAGCSYCYARKMARRLKAMGQPRYAQGFEPTFHPEALDAPLRWRKPRRVFVVSMGDLFDHAITDDQIAAVFGVMAACPQHTFQLLTKRPERMAKWFEWLKEPRPLPMPPQMRTFNGIADCRLSVVWAAWLRGISYHGDWLPVAFGPWPLPNVWLMVTAEDQPAADERIPWLLRCPAAVLGVSVEPMLGPIDFGGIGNALFDRRAAIRRCMYGTAAMNEEQADSYIGRVELNWVICGCDSSPGAARPLHSWATSLCDQCVAAGVPFFLKQWRDANGRKVSLPEFDGRTWAEFPKVTR